MNSPNDPLYRAPIAAPDGTIHPTPYGNTMVTPGDWSTAPKVVKNWARPLAMLAMIGYLIFALISAVRIPDATQSALYFLMFGGMFALNTWLVWALRKGAETAWSVQVLASVIGLLNCGIGTLLHAYILTQWFKPEVKDWFGRR